MGSRQRTCLQSCFNLHRRGPMCLLRVLPDGDKPGSGSLLGAVSRRHHMTSVHAAPPSARRPLSGIVPLLFLAGAVFGGGRRPPPQRQNRGRGTGTGTPSTVQNAPACAPV